MDQETKKEFEELTLIIRDSFGELESQMATKTELQKVKTDLQGELQEMRVQMATKTELQKVKTDLQGELQEIRVQMDVRFDSLRAELVEIKIKIRDLDNRMEKLFKTETEDVSAFYRDFTELKLRVERVEKFMRFQSV